MYKSQINEFSEILEKELNPAETFDFMKDHADTVLLHPKQFYLDIKEFLREYAETHGLCPECGAEDYTEKQCYQDDDADGNRGRWVTYRICNECGEEF